jgi:hypothetical protein
LEAFSSIFRLNKSHKRVGLRPAAAHVQGIDQAVVGDDLAIFSETNQDLTAHFHASSLRKTNIFSGNSSFF